ncbi:MAG: hypothetical protein QW175_06280 [Candidatus Bathyarchaeia archaeon]
MKKTLLLAMFLTLLVQQCHAETITTSLPTRTIPSTTSPSLLETGLAPYLTYFGPLFWGILYLTVLGAMYVKTRKIVMVAATAAIMSGVFSIIAPAQTLMFGLIAVAFAVAAAVTMAARGGED